MSAALSENKAAAELREAYPQSILTAAVEFIADRNRVIWKQVGESRNWRAEKDIEGTNGMQLGLAIKAILNAADKDRSGSGVIAAVNAPTASFTVEAATLSGARTLGRSLGANTERVA